MACYSKKMEIRPVQASPAPELSVAVLTDQATIRVQIQVAAALAEVASGTGDLNLEACQRARSHHSLSHYAIQQAAWLATSQAGAQLSADRLAVEHVGAEVVQVVRYGCAQAKVANTVVAPCILTLLVAYPQHLHETCFSLTNDAAVET